MIESITVTSLLAILFSHVIYHIVGHNANEALIHAFAHLKKGGKPVNHDLQKALKRSKLSAFRQIAQECSEELEAESPRTASHARDWLAQKIKQLEMELRQVDHATPEESIFDSLDKITALLTEDRLTTQRRELTQQLIHEALGNQQAPECYHTKVKEEIFEYVCVQFANEIKETPTVRHIFDSQMLVQIAKGQKEIWKKLSQLEAMIATILANQTKMYQEWYKATYQLDADTSIHQVGYLPELGSLKKRFKYWFNQDEQRPLKQKICQIWLQLRQTQEFDKKRDLIVAMAVDITLTPFIHPYHTVVIVTILVTEGLLDKLCANDTQSAENAGSNEEPHH
ncbi:MAG: hypothetical protein BWK78_00965 [Thiotrichaceae bacterium IS1]|nr:MAG: hypothetical protein BWK78_00965 [Thiotrichaceae bacterium IS1]